MKISACIIVKDELATLPACLRTLVGYIDEIIIVDTGSTDGTPYLIDAWIKANKSETKIVQDYFKWCDDFSAARNYAMSKATGDWIFTVDADDRCEISDWGPLKRFLHDPDGQLGDFDLIACDVHNLYGKNGTVRSKLCQARFFRTERGPAYRGAVHNQAYFPDLKRDVNAARSSFRIYHVGYGSALSKEKLVEKGDRVLGMCKKQTRKTPKLAFAWMNYAVALKNKLSFPDSPENQHKKFIPQIHDACNKAMHYATTKQRHHFVQAVVVKGWIHYVCQEFEESNSCADQALKEKPDFLDALLLKGFSYTDAQRLPEAEFWLNQYLIQQKKYRFEEKFDFVPVERSDERVGVYKALAAIELHRQHTDDAKRYSMIQGIPLEAEGALL